MFLKSLIRSAVAFTLAASPGAFAWNSSSYPDNTVVASSTDKSRWLIVGGARFYIHPEQWANFAAPSISLTAAAINDITPIPRDGTVLGQSGRPEVFTVVGGMFFHVPDPTELQYFNPTQVRALPANKQHFPSYGGSGEGKLVKERTGTQTYLLQGNAKFPVSASELPSFTGPVQLVPNTSLAKISNTPDCGVLLRERATTDNFLYTGNGKYKLTQTELDELGGNLAVKVVPQGTLAAFPNVSTGLSGGGCMKGNGGRYVTLTVAASNKCVQPAGKSPNNDVAIVQGTCDGSAAQKFQLLPYPDGSYMIRGQESGRCLDVRASLTDDATPVLQWNCHSGMNQRVELRPLTGGGYNLVFKHSLKCLDLNNAGLPDGTIFHHYQCNGTPAQTFHIN
ncbi:RICIN domain-containing protein [Melittangium boletus]|uniref:QXW lectin containing protein n=1 Tax=Melittangium boletus DSM 14713 TaxID=1294270 RepID=A0A250IPT6_9BACT|nr:RICIN domain-containing protein [Melittangium boletus]ATB33252.1 QXW lectin containing protein [Melittangium boletus DSM 14713]